MDYPLISVVTCTYKKFDTIFVTIDSLLKQDYPYIEYIITDDGSENFPYQEISAYIEKNRQKNLVRYQIIQHPMNLGTVRNINGAFKMAQGKYVMGLSGDDVYYDNNVLSTVIARMEEQDSNLLIASRLVCDCNMKPQYVLPHYLFRNKLLRKGTAKEQHDLFISGQYYAMASGSAMFFKKSFLEQEGYFDEKYLLWEDGPYLERYFRNNKIDMAYDIISIKYQLGGISTNKKVSDKLLIDTELYDATDRIEKISSTSRFYKNLTLCNITYSSRSASRTTKLKTAVSHPCISIYKVFYKILYKFAELYDRKVYVPYLEKQTEVK